MRVRTGFTLIEMMIVLMLGSIVIGIMLSSYSQLQRTTRTFDSRVDLESDIIAIASLFERDVSGACIPLQSYVVEKESAAAKAKAGQEKAKPQNGSKPESGNTPKQPDSGKAPSGQAEDKESQQKTPEVKAIFYAEAGDEDTTQFFTCITDNPLDIYWSEGAGRAKPKIARVIYRLKKNERGNKASYSLFRQEGSDLDLNSYTKTDSSYRSYLVSDAVSEFALTFYSYESNKEGKIEEDIAEFEYGSNQEVSLELPQLVTLDIAVYDPRQKRTQSFSMTYRIWGQVLTVEDQKQSGPEKPEEPKKDTKSTPIPPPQPNKENKSGPTNNPVPPT